MKYMNHLRKLALLSSLALSFSVAVQADGTLPLPIASNEKLPLKLAADTSDMTLTIRSMEGLAKPQKAALNAEPCGREKDVEYFKASGTLSRGIGSPSIEIYGVCKPRTSGDVETFERALVAKDPSIGPNYILINGTLGVEEVPDSTGVVLSTESLTLGSGLAGPEAVNEIKLYRIRP